MILRGVSLFDTKIRITLRKLNKNRKYFNPLVNGQWPRLVRMMKNTGGRKSRWTVPLCQQYFGMYTVIQLDHLDHPHQQLQYVPANICSKTT